MKYKIEKMQQGGGFATFTPIVRSAPLPASGNTTNEKSSNAGSEDVQSIIDKKLYEKLITEGGLVNDVNYFVDKISQISNQPLAFLDNSNVNSSLELIKDFNRVSQNKKLWDTTYKNAQDLGGLGEVAVGRQGELFVKDGNTFKAVSIGEYSKNKDKYNPLTVAELLRARQFDPNLVNNDAIFQVGETAYGTNKILEKIKDTINLVGDYHEKSEKHMSRSSLEEQLGQIGMLRAPSEQQKQGMAQLKQMLETPGEQYKVVSDFTTKKRYAKDAENYIMSSLTREEHNKLKAVAAINNTDVGSLISKALVVGLSGEENISEVSPEKVGAGEGEGSMKNLTNESNDELFFSGKLNTGERFAWNDPETGRVMSMPVTGKTVWHNEGKPTGMITVNQAAKTSLAQYIYAEGATFGGKPMSLSDKDKIVQEDSFSRVFLPTNYDGTPNLELLGQFKDAQEEVEKHPDWAPQQINDFYQERGLGYVQVDENGHIRTTANIKPYMVGYGYTTSQAAAASDNKHVERVPSRLEKDVDSALTKVYKEAKVDKPTTLGTWGTDYYRGIIAYPIRETASINAAANKGNVFSPKVTLDTSRTLLDAFTKGRDVPQNSAELLK